MQIGFDNDKYTAMQSERIRQRIDTFGGKLYMEFGKAFEHYFLDQGFDTDRTIDETLDLGWDLLSILPQSELDRVDNKLLEEKYHPERGAALLKEMRGEA